MIKKTIKALSLILFIVGLVVAQFITREKMSQLKYSVLKIEIPKDTPRYLDEKRIEDIVKAYVLDLKSTYVDSLNLDALEKHIELTTAIKKAEVFSKTTGTNLDFTTQLVVRVHQREPIVRVMAGSENYYMDDDGVRIDANQSYSAKVPLVTGIVNEEYMRKEILPLIKYIRANDFWNAQIKDISVDSSGELYMVPLIGSQTIEFGTPNSYKEKLRNLMALYEQGFSKLGWDKYQTIDLKYKGQVVCVSKQEDKSL